MTELLFDYLPADHPLNDIDPTMLRNKGHIFAAKLTKNDRRAIKALHHVGFTINALSRAFKINRRTVTKIIEEYGKSYRDIRDEFNTIGPAAFVSRYVHKHHIEMMDAVKKAEPEIDEMTNLDFQASQQVKQRTPNRSANAQRGINILKYGGVTHRIEVRYFNEGEVGVGAPEGWYVKCMDLDGYEEIWHTDPDSKSHMTSQTARLFGQRFIKETVGEVG